MTQPNPTWPKCDHSRTPTNTANVSARKPGGECRLCKQRRQREYAVSDVGRERRRRADDRYASTTKAFITRTKYRFGKRAEEIDKLPPAPPWLVDIQRAAIEASLNRTSASPR